MGNLILIAIGVILVIFILRFLFKSIKTLFYVALVLILGAVALHFYSPETIDKYIGKENHDRIASIVEDKTDTLIEQGKEKANDLLEDGTEAAKDKAKEIANDAIDKVGE